MRGPFTGKTIWITGASSGIGEALAYECARLGAQLVLSARNETALLEVISRCHQPELHRAFPMDMSALEQHRVEIEAFLSTHKVDILVNNAGIGQRSGAMETSLDDTRYLMEVNFFSVIELSRMLVKHFQRQGSGYLVIVSSVMGHVSLKRRTSYAASKHALHGFFDGFRAELADIPIPVTLVCPGYVRTNLAARAIYGTDSAKEVPPTGLKGIDATFCARQITRAMLKKKNEVIIAHYEGWAVRLKRFFPGFWNFLLTKLPAN